MPRAIPDATWNEVFAKGDYNIEFKTIIGTQEYYGDSIIDLQITRPLFSKYEVGNATCAQLILTVETTAVPTKGAQIEVQIRIVAGEKQSSWASYGFYYIDNRKTDQSTGLTTFTAYDAMYKAEAVCAETITFPFFPYPFLETATDIAIHIGVGIEAKTLNFLFKSSYNVEYPNELTMREVLGYMAAACGGNFFINTSNELQFAPMVWDFDDFHTFQLEVKPSQIETADIGRRDKSITGVRVWYDDENAFESGTSATNLIELHCPWATQAMADSLYSFLRQENYRYHAFSLKKCDLSPLIELGDFVYSYFADSNYNYENIIGNIVIYGNGLMDISAPETDETESELKYKGTIKKELARKITLGADYYGTSITRQKGIVVERKGADETVKAKVILNADEFTFYNDGIKSLYFDIDGGEYVFKGKITADSGEIAGLVIGKDDNDRGYIATKGKTSAGKGNGIFLSYNEFGIGTDFYVGTEGKLQAKGAVINGRFDAIFTDPYSSSNDFDNGIYFYNTTKADANKIGGIWYYDDYLYFNTTNNNKLKIYSSGNSSYQAPNLYFQTSSLYDGTTSGFSYNADITCTRGTEYGNPTVDLYAYMDINNAHQGASRILVVGGTNGYVSINAPKIGFFGSTGYTKQTINVGDIYTMMNDLLTALSNYGIINYV